MMVGRLKEKKVPSTIQHRLAGSFNHEMLKVLVKTVTDIELFHIQTLIESIYTKYAAIATQSAD